MLLSFLGGSEAISRHQLNQFYNHPFIMKNIKTTILSLLLMAVAVSGVQAHALWIHTASKAELGKAHKFTIYYADYNEKAIEKVDDWYSDVSDFELYAVSPSGKRSKLSYEKGEENAKGSFIPEEEGVYRLEIGHNSKTEPGKTVYQFNAVAYVHAGKATGTAGFESAPDLVLAPKAGGYQVLLSGAPLADSEVGVLGPDGKSVALKTDSKGFFASDLTTTGTYFIEATTYKELPKNDPSGMKAIWRCATQVLVVE